MGFLTYRSIPMEETCLKFIMKFRSCRCHAQCGGSKDHCGPRAKLEAHTFERCEEREVKLVKIVR